MPLKLPSDAEYLKKNWNVNLVGHDDKYVCILPSNYQPDATKPDYEPVWVKVPMKCLVVDKDGEYHSRYSMSPLDSISEDFVDGTWEQKEDLHLDITFPLQPAPCITSKILEAVVIAELCTNNYEFYERYKNYMGLLGDMFTCADFLGFTKTQHLIGQLFQFRLTRSCAGAKRPNHKTGRKGNIRYELECILQSDKTNDQVLDDIVDFFKKAMGYLEQKSLLTGRKRGISEIDSRMLVVPSRPLKNFTLDMLKKFEFIPVHAITCMYKKIRNGDKREERQMIKWSISKRYEIERQEWEDKQAALAAVAAHLAAGGVEL